MNPYRSSPAIQIQLPIKKRSWVRTFLLKTHLRLRGKFKDRYDRCPYCKTPICSAPAGDNWISEYSMHTMFCQMRRSRK